MKIPAIRAQIGVWVYYISTLSFAQVSKYVRKVDDELHKSELLREMLQRAITDNYKGIADYIVQQEERFFNALVLAVYDGDPQWNEVRLEYDDGDPFYDLGILELRGDEKIFPIDGQHRSEGIKKVLSEHEGYENEKIPVIFIGHKKNDDGMKRARRMFSTLNRYAKKVSLRDIIALDEDDVIAIACRELMDNNFFFGNKRILDSKNKAIHERNKEFTTIITLYECNEVLLSMFIAEKEIRNRDGNIIKSSNRKLEAYVRYRPNDTEINEFVSLCDNFWTELSDFYPELHEYKNQSQPDASKYRNRQGGSLFFRPTALLALVKVFVFLKIKWNCSFRDTFQAINKFPLTLDSEMWKYILWNPVKGTMITTNSPIVRSLLLYCVDKTLLNSKETESLISSLQDARQTDRETIENEFLEQFIKRTGDM